MIDPAALGFTALAQQSPAAVGWTFLAGLLTSIGPCIAPRYLAIAALASGSRRPFVTTLAYVGGLIGALVTLGLTAGALGSVWRWSGSLYAVMATALIVGGASTLVRAGGSHCSDDACSHARHAAAGAPVTRRGSLGAIFLFGAASAFVVSPCCTPVIAGIIAVAASIGKPLYGVLLLASFSAGHVLPLVFAGNLTTVVNRIAGPRLVQATAIVSGVLMLALGAYYGAIA